MRNQLFSVQKLCVFGGSDLFADVLGIEVVHDKFERGKIIVELPTLQEKTVPVTISENLSTYQMTIAIGNTILGVSESTPMELLSRVLKVVRNA